MYEEPLDTFFLVLSISLSSVLVDIAVNEGFSWRNQMRSRTDCSFVAVILLMAVSLLFWLLSSKKMEHLDKFLNDHQLEVLALVVALAAYVSSVKQKLYETIRSPLATYVGGRDAPPGSNFAGHVKRDKNEYEPYINRLDIADGLLVTTGVLTVIRIALSVTSGNELDAPTLLSLGIIVLLVVIILYFAILHICQLRRR